MKKQIAAGKARRPIGLEDLNDKLDLVIGAMATTRGDVAKIWDAMATKDDIALVVEHMAIKEDIARLENDISDIHAVMATKKDVQDMDDKFTAKFHENLLATEGFTKPISELRIENAGIMMHLAWHDEQIASLAQK